MYKNFNQPQFFSHIFSLDEWNNNICRYKLNLEMKFKNQKAIHNENDFLFGNKSE